VRSACALVVVLMGCSDRGDGIPVLGDSGLDGTLDGAVEDAPCPAGQSLCSGRCLDVSGDPLNCGGCGAMCSSTDVCSGGLCVPTASPLQ